MSMTFYAYRETARGAEFSDGPNFSNANARMILRSLGYGEEILDDYGEPGPLDPRDAVSARACWPVAGTGAPATSIRRSPSKKIRSRDKRTRAPRSRAGPARRRALRGSRPYDALHGHFVWLITAAQKT